MAETTTAATATKAATTTTATEQAGTPADHITEEEWFDLLPIEVKLVKYSLALGIGLLVIFVIIFRVIPIL